MQSDALLVQALQGPEAEMALEELIRRHGALVLRAAQRLTAQSQAADDICQAVFLVLMRRAANLTVSDSLGPWLHQTAVLVGKAYLRAEQRRKTKEQQVASMAAARNPEKPVELPEGFDEALASLPVLYRQPIVLRYLENRSRDEVAGMLGISVGALDVRTSRGVERLRHRLGAAALSVLVLTEALGAEATVAAATAPKLALIQAVCLGKTTAPAPVVDAAEAGLAAALAAKLKFLGLLALMALGCAGVGIVGYRTLTNSPPAAVSIRLDAFSATLTPPMALGTDVQNRTFFFSPTENTGWAEFTPDLPRAGDYFLWARVLAADVRSDSFFVSVDGGEEKVFDIGENSWSSDWQWKLLTRRIEPEPAVPPVPLEVRKLKLSAGSHTLRFRAREPQAKLSEIVLTESQSFRPGEPKSNKD